jgi:hypothetical protein
MTTYPRRAIAGSIFWIASLSLIRAQSVSIYSSIVGTVTDSSGAAVPDAKVVATNLSTNSSTLANTDSQGLYRVDRLVLGKYQVVATHPGFKGASCGSWEAANGGGPEDPAHQDLLATGVGGGSWIRSSGFGGPVGRAGSGFAKCQMPFPKLAVTSNRQPTSMTLFWANCRSG